MEVATRWIAHIVLILCLLLSTVAGHMTACNQGNATLCLEGSDAYQGVKGVLADPTKFWFGDTYQTTCPLAQGRHTVRCMNPDPNFRSIITRMRMSNNNDTSDITQVLTVHWGVDAGWYEACGSRTNVSAVDYTVDSTHSVYTDSWALSRRPHIMWTAEPNVKYTLAFWDAGHFRLHGLWVNINTGGHFMENMGIPEVVPYQGPVNFFYDVNPFTFVLLKQTTDVNVTAAFEYVTQLLRQEGHVKMNKLMTQLQLTGPVAVGLLQMRVDEYTAEMGARERMVNNCPYLRTSDLATLLPMYNTTGMSLSVSVDATFMNDPADITSCCQRMAMKGERKRTDSMFNTMIPPMMTRNAPRVTLTNTFLMDEPYYFAHRRFTLLMLDMTGLTENSTTGAVLHWQVINIADMDLTTGETATAYAPALVVPPATQRTYVLLLLEQPGDMTVQQVTGMYTALECGDSRLQGRCMFNLPKMMNDLNLQLAGITGFRSSPDPWARMEAYSNNGVPKATACMGVQGFADPCPTAPAQCTNSGGMGFPSLTLLLISLAALAYF